MAFRKQTTAEVIESIPEEAFPNHVLIIPDGNGRWAEKFHKLPSFGHKHGFKILRKVVRQLQNFPIDILTIWAFSSDNWKRGSQETSALMKIAEAGIKESLPEIIEKKMRFVHLGRRDRIPKALKKIIEAAEKQTKNNSGKIFCVAIDFSGQDQEIRIIEKVLKLPKKTKIDFKLIKKLRDSEGIIPPADLIIRTSGEQRTSDLGWLSQNSEFYSIEKLLPETDTKDFLEAIIDYTKRERRFGGRST